MARFDALGIETWTVEHAPLYTVEESRALRGEIAGGHCKSLFLKDRKGGLWLIVALEDTRLDLKSVARQIGAAKLSFGRPELMEEVLGIAPGSVTPFALINDREGQVSVVLEAAMMAHEQLNYHPLTNTATTTIASADLARFVRACGHEPRILELAG